MKYTLSFVSAAAVLALAISPAAAKPCRDASGHFTACPKTPPAAAASAQRCRDASGHFAKCPASTAAAVTTPAPAPAPRATARATLAPRARTGAAANTAAVAPALPGAVTARCRDGSMSHSTHRSGTCSRHGGVAAWM